MKHWQPKTEKTYLMDEVSEWIRRATKDDSDGLRDGARISKRDLEAICRAITHLENSHELEA